jgi:hypothetical protein
MRFDNEIYNYYDYRQIYVYSNIRFDLGAFFLKAGYNLRYRDYINLSYLTNLRHYGYAQINMPFKTRTTLIIEADVGQKSFAGQEIYTTSTSGGGYGRHSNTNGTTSVTTYVPSLSHFILLGRIAQSLHETIGLYIQYRQKINLGNSFSLNNVEGFYQDEELFDDPFSYESKGISSQITWMMPWSMRLQIGGNLIDKNYISEQAYISPEDTLASGGLRIDDQTYYFLNFSKSFFLNKSWLNVLKVNFYFNYIENNSNSFWYNYTNRVLGGGIQWIF